MDTKALWDSVKLQFAGQALPKIDADWHRALNRIANKQIFEPSVPEKISLSEDNCDLALVSRTREQVEAAKRAAKVTHANHGRRSVGKPPILLAWLGRELLIDGHNRINIFLASGSPGPIECIVVTPRPQITPGPSYARATRKV